MPECVFLPPFTKAGIDSHSDTRPQLKSMWGRRHPSCPQKYIGFYIKVSPVKLCQYFFRTPLWPSHPTFPFCVCIYFPPLRFFFLFDISSVRFHPPLLTLPFIMFFPLMTSTVTWHLPVSNVDQTFSDPIPPNSWPSCVVVVPHLAMRLPFTRGNVRSARQRSPIRIRSDRCLKLSGSVNNLSQIRFQVRILCSFYSIKLILCLMCAYFSQLFTSKLYWTRWTDFISNEVYLKKIFNCRWNKTKTRIRKVRISVSDPHGSAKDFPPGSRFGSAWKIKIWIQLNANLFREPKSKALFKGNYSKNRHREVYGTTC